MTVRDQLARVKPAWIVIAAWVIAIAYAYPGYLSIDAAEHMAHVRAGRIYDWHPPVMTWYWQLVERLVRGPFPLLVLQTSLSFWGLFALLQQRISPRASALATAAVLLFPPVLTSLAQVGPDAQMAGFLLAGFALALRPLWRWRAVGLALLLLAVAVRTNAAAALVPLCILVVGAWGIRRRAVVVAAGFALCAALVGVATVASTGLRDSRTYPWYRTIAVTDIAGTICVEGGTDAQIERLVRGVTFTHAPGRDLHAQMCGAFEPRPWSEMLRPDPRLRFAPRPDRDDRLARKRAWVRLAKHHTDAFVAYRWSVMKQLLGLGDPPEERVSQTIGHAIHVLPGTTLGANPLHHRGSLSWFQRQLGRGFAHLAETPLYRPWLYAVLALLLLVVAAIKRNELAVAFAYSGLVFEATLFIAAPAPRFGFSLWMIACTCIAIASVVLGRRARA